MNRLSLLFVPIFLLILSLNGQCSDGATKTKINQHQVFAEVFDVDIDVIDSGNDLDNSTGKVCLPQDLRLAILLKQSAFIYSPTFFPRDRQTSLASIRSPPISA
jgi:hypothetical protein